MQYFDMVDKLSTELFKVVKGIVLLPVVEILMFGKNLDDIDEVDIYEDVHPSAHIVSFRYKIEDKIVRVNFRKFGNTWQIQHAKLDFT